MNSRKATSPALLAAFVLALFSGAAHADTITFDTATVGTFTGPVTENGYTYSTLAGGLFVTSSGNPGNDMEGANGTNGGILDIKSATSANFTFAGLDFSAFGDPKGSEFLFVEGFRNGAITAFDTYLLGNSSTVPFNWVTENAFNLAGVTIDELQISLGADIADTNTANIDNVVLNAAVTPIPEPSSFVLVGTGVLGGVLVALRRRFAA
jgi:hypothetical protein